MSFVGRNARVLDYIHEITAIRLMFSLRHSLGDVPDLVDVSLPVNDP